MGGALGVSCGGHGMAPLLIQGVLAAPPSDHGNDCSVYGPLCQGITVAVLSSVGTEERGPRHREVGEGPCKVKSGPGHCCGGWGEQWGGEWGGGRGGGRQRRGRWKKGEGEGENREEQEKPE